MNGTLTRTHTMITPAAQDFFATAPMLAILREPEQCEEEAYTSFEAAIGNRVLALKERHISTYMDTAVRGMNSPATNQLINRAFTVWHNVCSRRRWKRSVLLFSIALMFMLIGFDLMGWLVLTAR